MSGIGSGVLVAVLIAGAQLVRAGSPQDASLVCGKYKATIAVSGPEETRTYELLSNAPLRDNRPEDKRVVFSENKDRPTVRTGSLMFDGLYAMAVHEAVENSVPEVKDYAYNHGNPIRLDAFETGEKWNYVWTRDLAYSVHLALAGFDPPRSRSSLLFKASALKSSVSGKYPNQIIQDTGSGGSWPVSTDRVVWSLGVWETLKYLKGQERESFLKEIYPILRDTIELDRIMVYDSVDGLYRGEQSFLDWREQTYPGWTKENVLPIAMSKALSVNVLNCYLLTTAADCAEKLNAPEEAKRYRVWATDLRAAVNRNFYDSAAGRYSAYLLSDGLCSIRVNRRDLLGESLAILFDVADEKQAKRIIGNYPVGPHGPPVVWPQERTVPIYHNQGIWPFVTAYWIKAARKAGNAAAVNCGVESLQALAALNLSNMENFDFVSGLAEVNDRPLNGPVINSRRQLWSVAGYLSMVQDVVFGLETSMDGIRFKPFITASMRSSMFQTSERIELRGFQYLETRHNVRIHLPPTDPGGSGVYAVSRTLLNDAPVDTAFVPENMLRPVNHWEIYLEVDASAAGSVRMVDVHDRRTLYAPLQPQWEGITVEDGKRVLKFSHPGQDAVFNIYRDGQLMAERIDQTRWVDHSSAGYSAVLQCYTVEAVDPVTGNTSHVAPFRRHAVGGHRYVIPAVAMENKGGRLVSDHHFADWGKPDHQLLTRPFTVGQDGSYVVCAQYANGMPVNTGITCGIKALELLDNEGRVAASGYLIMPHTGGWDRWSASSFVSVPLKAGSEYRLRIVENECSRNMSTLRKNRSYTSLPGGGPDGFNIVDIASLQLELLTTDKSVPKLR